MSFFEQFCMYIGGVVVATLGVLIFSILMLALGRYALGA